MTKVCSRCGEIKPLSEFSVRRASRDGYSAACKSCCKIARDEYRKSEKGKAAALSYQRSERCKAAVKRYQQSQKGKVAKKRAAQKYRTSKKGIETQRAYGQREYVKQRRHEYRISDWGREKRREYERSEKGKKIAKNYRESADGKVSVLRRSNKYNKTNKGRINRQKKAHKRRAVERSSVVGPINFDAIYSLCGNRCAYCGGKEVLTVDHIVPLSKGGSHTEDNLLVACKSCNSSKGVKPLEKWIGTRVRTLAAGSDMLDCELV